MALAKATQDWLSKFNSIQAGVQLCCSLEHSSTPLDEREIYHAESGMDRELDFNPEDDLVNTELSSMLEKERPKLNIPKKMSLDELRLFFNNLDD